MQMGGSMMMTPSARAWLGGKAKVEAKAKRNRAIRAVKRCMGTFLLVAR
jgi:hypothetical protein